MNFHLLAIRAVVPALSALRLLLALFWLGLSSLAQAAPPAQPSDNNLHIDRGVAYSSVLFLSTTGGQAPYTFSFPGSLPIGITVSSDGLLSGVTCGANGSYPLGVVTVTSFDASESPPALNAITR